MQFKFVYWADYNYFIHH